MVFLPVVLIAFCWLQLFNEVRSIWASNEQYGYGWFVPLLAAALAWKRWQLQPGLAGGAGLPAKSARGLGLVVVAGLLLLFPFRLLEAPNPVWIVLHWVHAFVLMVISLSILLLWGGPPMLRQFWFPVFFLLTGLAWPSRFDDWLTQGLMRQVARVTVEVVGLLDIPAIAHGSVIEISNGTVGIDEACSGIRSLQTSIMLALLLGELMELTRRRRLLLLPFGICVALLANLGRTSFLTWCAAAKGFDAMHAAHDPAGLAVVGVVMGSLVLLSWFWGRPAPAGARVAPAPVAPAPAPAAARAGLGALSARALMAGCLWVLVAEGAVWGWYHWPGRAPAAAPAWAIQWPSNEVGFAISPLGKRELEILACSKSSSARWSDSDGNSWWFVYENWAPDPALRMFVGGHNPEQCFAGSGATFLTKLEPVEFKAGGFDMKLEHRIFDQNHHQLHVFMGTWEPFVPSSGQRLFSKRTFAFRLANVLEHRLILGGTTFEIGVVGPTSEAEANAAFQKQMSRLILSGS